MAWRQNAQKIVKLRGSKVDMDSYVFMVSFIWMSMFDLGEGLYEEQDQADRRSPQLHSAQVGM